tara:strand:+ start:2540 stop:3967 length:1428 start_codon:yes stop_codon:yes gene_type:complete
MAKLPVLTTIQLAWSGGKAPGSPSGTGGGQRDAGGGGKDKEQEGQYRKVNKSNKSFLKSSLGINFGVAAMLKQSQIFTGVIGTIFQLIGALVDVILAPFLPVLIPAIKEIASWIPKVAGWARKTYEFLAPIFAFFNGLFDKLPGMITGPIEAMFTAVILTGLVARLFGFWGAWKGTMKLALKGAWAVLKLVNVVVAGIAPAVNKVAGDVLKGIGQKLTNTVGVRIVAAATSIGAKLALILNPISSLSSRFARFAETPIKTLGTKIAGLFPETFKTALTVVKTAILNKLANIFPTGWMAALGRAISEAAKSGIKKLGGALGRIGLGGVSTALGMTKKLPARDALGRFASVAAKKPGVWANAAKAVPLLSTAVTAGMAVYRTTKAASEGDWKRAGAYAAAGAAFTVGQLAADLSSVTGVGLAASGGLAVAEMVVLDQIDKRMKDQPPTNQDAAQNAFGAPPGVVGVHTPTLANGLSS